MPAVVAAADRVLITEWLDGTPLSKVIATGTAPQRDRAGAAARQPALLGAAAGRAAARRPAPGQLPAARRRAAGRARLRRGGPAAGWPSGADRPAGPAGAGRATPRRCSRAARGGLHPRRAEIDAQAVLDYLLRCWSRSQAEEFQFTRAWLRAEAARVASPRSPAYAAGPAAQPAAGLPAHPPGDAGLDRRAVPAGGAARRTAPSWSAGCPASPATGRRRRAAGGAVAATRSPPPAPFSRLR